uniref:Copine C-terminal domain-containing protein n=1 Tax=Acrobeloides nanus TaxID=290746 RepID=A0A914D0D3_9BILA
MFDAYGFGAKIPPTYQVSHLFPLNVSTMNSTVHGVEGVMEAYRICLRSTQIYGPTNFSPVINAVAQKAAYIQQGDRYQVLLIITDGVITDMQKTLSSIIQASTLPLSIIIVGVGGDSFEKMDALDSDNQLLSFNGKIAARDIVQFVPFRNFLTGAQNDYSMVQAALAKEVLAEVPDQVTSYMKSKNIAPKPPQNPTPEQADGIYPNPLNPHSNPIPYDQGSVDTARFSESSYQSSSSPYNTPRMSINQGQPPYPTPYPVQAAGIQRSSAPYAPYPLENSDLLATVQVYYHCATETYN